MRKEKFTVWRLPTYLVMAVWSLLVIFPLIWTLYSSFKTSREFYADPWALPQSVAIGSANYAYAWSKANLASNFVNSIITTSTVVIALILLGAMAAYVIARTPHYRPSSVIGNLFMFGMLVPMVFGILPTFLLLYNLRLLDTMSGLILTYIAYALPFTVFILQSFLKTLPRELEEAALIDGSTMNRTFWTIIFPLARPGILTVSIFNFVGHWNEYVMANTLIASENIRTISLGLANLMKRTQYESNWGGMFAGIIIVTLPTILIYALFQRGITGGLTVGAVK